jgi:hypothetical protein
MHSACRDVQEGRVDILVASPSAARSARISGPTLADMRRKPTAGRRVRLPSRPRPAARPRAVPCAAPGCGLPMATVTAIGGISTVSLLILARFLRIDESLDPSPAPRLPPDRPLIPEMSIGSAKGSPTSGRNKCRLPSLTLPAGKDDRHRGNGTINSTTSPSPAPLGRTVPNVSISCQRTGPAALCRMSRTRLAERSTFTSTKLCKYGA